MLTPRESGGTHSSRADKERRWTASTVKPFVAGATGFALGAGLLSATMTGFAASPPGTEAASDDGKAGTASVVSGNAGPAVRVAEAPGGGTFRGTEGDDVLTGTGGSDSMLAAGGNDRITALGGDDVLTGDNGDDAIDAGPGFDIIFGGQGNDFTTGGADGNEHILGSGNDFTVSGDGANTVFGGDGDDWVEGGSTDDLILSDAGSPYGETVNAPGDDVLISNGGQDDFHAGSGDDVMFAGDGAQRNDGADGFDWSAHSRDAAAADVDLRMLFDEEIPPDTEDRYRSVEALSGGDDDDVLRGDDRVPASEAAGSGNALNAAGIARLAGLADLLPQGTATWGAGNIIFGGNGSDILEGRGADDIIDGDAALHVRLSVRTNPSDPATETTSAASLDQLQVDILAGTIDPASIVAVLEMRVDRESSEDDTAVFSGAQSEYDVSTEGGVTTVVHARGTGADGTDTLSGIEMLQFSDVILDLETGESESPDPTEEPTEEPTDPTEEPTGEPTDPAVVFDFTDVNGKTLYREQIRWAAREGITTGWKDGTFRPYTATNRDAMAAFLYRLAGEPEFQAPAVSPFVDYGPNNSFYKEVTWLHAQGITTGWTDGPRDTTAEYRPFTPVARDAMAAFIYRFASLDGDAFQGPAEGYEGPAQSPFADYSHGNLFYDEISWLAEQGISTGWTDGPADTTAEFRPFASINRDAMVVFMWRLAGGQPL